MDIFTTLLVMGICLIFEAFFSGSEIGVVSADRMLLRHNAAQGSKGAKLALKMLETPEWLLSTTLVGTNIAVVTNTTMATALVIDLFGEQYSWLAVVTVAPLIWVFGEIVPKSVFQQNANTLTPIVIYPLRIASVVFWPLLAIFTLVTKLLSRLAGGATLNPFTLREEIATMMGMSPSGGDILPAEQTMIRRVFDFSETTAEEVMVPLIDVAGISISARCGEVTRKSVDRAHKRLPVFEERVDRIVGVVNALEVLDADPDEAIAPFVRSTLYVPGSKSVQVLLREMRAEKSHIAVVVDEFGGADGIVTIEDIIEEVVGELEDEFDVAGESKDYRKLGPRDYLIKGRAHVESLREEIELDIPEGEYETIAGFLLHITNDIPGTGAVVRYRDHEFKIESATEQAIKEVRVRW